MEDIENLAATILNCEQDDHTRVAALLTWAQNVKGRMGMSQGDIAPTWHWDDCDMARHIMRRLCRKKEGVEP